jgi:hypothetical protein
VESYPSILFGLTWSATVMYFINKNEYDYVIHLLGVLSPFCGVTKDIMSRGPQVVDIEC